MYSRKGKVLLMKGKLDGKSGWREKYKCHKFIWQKSRAHFEL